MAASVARRRYPLISGSHVAMIHANSLPSPTHRAASAARLTAPVPLEATRAATAPTIAIALAAAGAGPRLYYVIRNYLTVSQR